MTKEHALMLMVDESGAGQMIVDGKGYMVRSTWTKYSATSGGFGGWLPRWDIHVTAEKSLDEAAQQARIAGLEAELARERERLEDIRVALSGDETEVAS